MAKAFTSCNAQSFWSEVKRINTSLKDSHLSLPIDGVSSDLPISNLWAFKLYDLYNSQDVTEQDNLQANAMRNIFA